MYVRPAACLKLKSVIWKPCQLVLRARVEHGAARKLFLYDVMRAPSGRVKKNAGHAWIGRGGNPSLHHVSYNVYRIILIIIDKIIVHTQHGLIEDQKLFTIT